MLSPFFEFLNIGLDFEYIDMFSCIYPNPHEKKNATSMYICVSIYVKNFVENMFMYVHKKMYHGTWQCTMVHWQCTMIHWQCTMVHWQCTIVQCTMAHYQYTMAHFLQEGIERYQSGGIGRGAIC